MTGNVSRLTTDFGKLRHGLIIVMIVMIVMITITVIIVMIVVLDATEQYWMMNHECVVTCCQALRDH